MIILIQQRPIETLPPVISLLRVLKSMDEALLFICLEKTHIGELILDDLGIRHKFYPYEITTFKKRPLYRIWQKLTRFVRPYLSRRWVWKTIEENGGNCEKDILWSSEFMSAAVLGDRALTYGKRHVQSLYELGDEVGKDWFGFNANRFYESATLIECEYNRAHILKAEKGLVRLPFVLPNKPYAHPRRKNIEVTDLEAAKVVALWKDKKVFLYQGALQSDRAELFKILDILCKSQPNAVIAVMGKRSMAVEELNNKYKNFSFIPFVSPQHHLEVTSHADIGIAYYQGGKIWGLSPLNPVYCAPNKIFEYAGFGIPIICNDIPGLKYTVGDSNAGLCLKSITSDSVENAVNQIFSRYDQFSRDATKFFESVDIVCIVKEILAYARS